LYRKPNTRQNAEEWEAIIPGNPHTYFQLEDFPFNRQVDETYQMSWNLWDSFNLPTGGDPFNPLP